MVDAGVDWPRHHLVVRDTLLVAGQRSDEIAALTLDIRTGVPSRPMRRAEAPAPTCLLPAR
jgi:6-phosphogluconolactonase (cycloisomerase 2 family)